MLSVNHSLCECYKLDEFEEIHALTNSSLVCFHSLVLIEGELSELSAKTVSE